MGHILANIFLSIKLSTDAHGEGEINSVSIRIRKAEVPFVNHLLSWIAQEQAKLNQGL